MIALLSLTAVRYVVSGACKAAGGDDAGMADHAARAVLVLSRHFTDPSGRLTRAIAKANDRSWQAMEVALAGDSFVERCKAVFTSAEDRTLGGQVREFLDKVPLAELPGDRAEFRRECLDQLRRARRAGTLTRGQLDPKHLEQSGGSFARYADPSALLDAEWQAVGQMADELQPLYPLLSRLLRLRAGQELPLLAMAARYYFRRAVEQDEELARGLSFARLEALSTSQDAGFARLGELMDRHAARMEELLDGVLAVAVQTREGVQRIEEQLAAYQKQIEQMIQRLGMKEREVQTKDSMSIKSDDERRAVREMLGRYRALPTEQRNARPALLGAVAQLENAAGDHEQALLDFQLVAELAGDDKAMEAQAHFNAYQAALERAGTRKTKDDEDAARDVAMKELIKAINKDRKYLPFDARKYVPQRILGAGGFGVTFLCKRRGVDDLVAVKSIAQENLGRDMGEVLREGQLLGQLDHPAIIRLIDCDYVDPDAKSAPFVVMSFFEGATLEDHVKRHKPPKPEEAISLFRLMAQGFRAAHDKGVLHRDIKPANLLVRRNRGGWDAKIIDFGLALRSELAAPTTTRRGQSVLGESIAGTANYAAPEQMDPERSREVGPWSDVYGFGKTCYYALFATPTPDDDDKDSLPDDLKRLLSRCTASTIAKRPQSFKEVGDALEKIERALIPAAEAIGAVEAVPVAAVDPAHQWYHAQGGQTSGPVTEARLKELLASGALKPTDAVWRNGLAGWAAAETIEGLVPRRVPAPPPPPPPPRVPALPPTNVATLRFFMDKGLLSPLSVIKKLMPGVHMLKVYINEKLMGERIPDEGFEYSAGLEPGTHTLEVVLWGHQGELCRKGFAVELPRPGTYRIRFNYVYAPPNPVAGFFGGDNGNHMDKSTIDIL